jgi:hypothetical protein
MMRMAEQIRKECLKMVFYVYDRPWNTYRQGMWDASERILELLDGEKPQSIETMEMAAYEDNDP